jgi:hypothetical protein
MSLIETKDELTTEITSEVDVMVNLYSTGLSTSIYIDDELFSDDVTWEQMAENILEDIRDDVYEADDIDDIVHGLQYIINEIINAIGK